MKTRALLGSGIASLSILVLGWQLGVQPATVQAGTTTTTTTTSTATTGSFTGATVTHEYGSVTVSITVVDGSLTDATAVLSTTHGDRSENINARAVPLLRNEVLTAQSAGVSMISGATYTSEAYLESLQSALDEAGL